MTRKVLKSERIRWRSKVMEEKKINAGNN